MAGCSPGVRRVAAYHYGFADADGNPISGGSGKALRPALALLSARAAGAAPERGVTPAVAVELVHNFSLLHDDIMDGDTERRHRPTAWTVFGVGAAILAGDAMLALANDLLLEEHGPGRPVGRALPVHRGAAADRRPGRGHRVREARRRERSTSASQMAGDKTAALMACACTIGAVHVGAPPELAMGLAEFGGHVGLAFQLTDDLLGIWGATEVTGKPVRADLRARKKSLPVVAALTSGTPAGRRAEGPAQPRHGELTEDDLVARRRPGGRGGRQAVGRAPRPTSRLAAAAKCLDDAGLPTDVHAEFIAIAEFITARQW